MAARDVGAAGRADATHWRAIERRPGRSDGAGRVAAFVHGLQAAGWSDGRNAQIGTRWAAADPGNYRKYAAELIALGPDVVLASTTAAVAQLQQASRTVPIVFVSAITDADA
jgi:putative ABC transport system substrate-binding protein